MVENTIERIDSDAALEELRHLLQAGRIERALELLTALHPADQADVIAEFESDERGPMLARMPTADLAELLRPVYEGVRASSNKPY